MKTFLKEGTIVNMLTIVKELPPRKRTDGNPRRVLLCKCECGEEKEILYQSVYIGRVKSCGCHQKQTVKNGKFATKHGLSSHPLFTVWKGMINRCYVENHKGFKHYGGRGISICEEWLKSPSVFVNWGLSNGWKKHLQIDRENNDGNYCPSNCRFVTRAINLANRRPYKKRILTLNTK